MTTIDEVMTELEKQVARFPHLSGIYDCMDLIKGIWQSLYVLELSVEEIVDEIIREYQNVCDVEFEQEFEDMAF